jgi:hypothetical protein
MKYSDLFRTAAAAALSLAVAAVPAVAKNNTAKAKPAAAKPASAGTKAKAQTPKAAKAPSFQAKGQPAKAKGATLTKSSTKPASTTTKGSSSKAARSGDGTPATSPRDLADDRPARSTQPLSKAQQKLLANETLRNKMRARLPRGTDPMVAAAGFKNLGQFVAAVNVSNNLGIDFTMLKGLMVNRGMSLGQAIQQAKAIEARRATSLASAAVRQADDEISATSLASVSATKKTKDKS